MRIRPYLRCAGRLSLLPLICLSVRVADASSATWKLDPVNNDWNNPLNWTPEVVPDDVATFDASTITSLNLDLNGSVMSVNSIVFNFGASVYTITLTNLSTIGGSSLSLNGSGVNNNSGVTQNFVIQSQSQFASEIDFHASASAGANTVFTNTGSSGRVLFLDNSTASSATFINQGGTTSSGNTFFFDNSTAGASTLIANSGPAGGFGGGVTFQSNSADAGGTARIQLSGNNTSDTTNGFLALSSNFPTTLRIGSVEGSGRVILGLTNLKVGANDLSTVISGVIEGFQGSLVKGGRGRLSLSNANSYNSTIVRKGTLVVDNHAGSGTGTGPVTVRGGTLAGNGIIAGVVTVGTNSGIAILDPGKAKKIPGGRLTVGRTVTFNAGILQIGLDSARIAADQLVCKGLSITGSGIAMGDASSVILPSGTVFMLVKNTSSQPILGTFANLPDGGTFMMGSNTYLISYSGGDGNDLTLTVVP